MLEQDVTAGMVNAVVSVPDGLASAALAGVNPVYGLYTSIAAPIVGSSIVSARLMQVSTTSASALAAGQAIAGVPMDQRDEALFLLVVLTGMCLVLFGLLRLGRLVRFVSHAVMTGFLAGVAVVLILDQAAPLLGLTAQGSNELTQFLDLLRRVPELDLATAATGVLALAIVIGLGRTRLVTFSSVIALVVPAVLVALVGWSDVQRVVDVSPIPRGIPMPSLPNLSLVTPSLVGAALALAVIIGVQGAGVSQSVENPDGSRVNVSRDLVAQGAGNIASGLFSGIPAGGSVGQTALNVSLRARSRWSGILAGVWMLVIVLVVPNLVGLVPMTVLAALMIIAGLSALDVREARALWTAGNAARLAILVTFAATLVFSIPMAVGAGVLLSTALYVWSSASDVRVRALVRVDDGRIAEVDPPRALPSRTVTVLDVYGSLFFAGARTLADALPDPTDATQPAVVLRLRGRTRFGATLIEVLDEYAEDLDDVGGRLYITGLGEVAARQLRVSKKFDASVQLIEADPILGAATERAVALAREWLQGDVGGDRVD